MVSYNVIDSHIIMGVDTNGTISINKYFNMKIYGIGI